MLSWVSSFLFFYIYFYSFGGGNIKTKQPKQHKKKYEIEKKEDKIAFNCGIYSIFLHNGNFWLSRLIGYPVVLGCHSSPELVHSEKDIIWFLEVFLSAFTMHFVVTFQQHMFVLWRNNGYNTAAGGAHPAVSSSFFVG